MQIKIFYVDFDKTDRDQRWDASRGDLLPEGCYTKVADRDLHPSWDGSSDLEACESLFARYQGEAVDPPLVDEKGARIRSMSIGDLIEVNNKRYIVDRGVGFREV